MIAMIAMMTMPMTRTTTSSDNGKMLLFISFVQGSAVHNNRNRSNRRDNSSNPNRSTTRSNWFHNNLIWGDNSHDKHTTTSATPSTMQSTSSWSLRNIRGTLSEYHQKWFILAYTLTGTTLGRVIRPTESVRRATNYKWKIGPVVVRYKFTKFYSGTIVITTTLNNSATKEFHFLAFGRFGGQWRHVYEYMYY